MHISDVSAWNLKHINLWSHLNFLCCAEAVSYSSCVYPSSPQGLAHKSTQCVWLDMTAPIKYCWWEERGSGLAIVTANIVRRINVSGAFVLLFQCRVHPDLLCLSISLLPLSCCPLPGCQLLSTSFIHPLFLSIFFLLSSPHFLSVLVSFCCSSSYQNSHSMPGMQASKQEVRKLCCETLQR